MRIVFIDFSPFDYNVETPYQRALGGTQSAAAYLAAELAALGEQIDLVTGTTSPGIHRAVRCFTHQQLDNQPDVIRDVDVAVIIQQSHGGRIVRPMLRDRAKLLLWPTDAWNIPTVASLAQPEQRQAYDSFVFVSEWQRDGFCDHFAIARSQTAVIGNAIGPAFENLFPAEREILPTKSTGPVMTYTLVPSRGLNVLLKVFTAVHKLAPDLRLKIYSSMKVHFVSDSQDQSEFGNLYRWAMGLEGVEYVGSVPQPQLAQELRSASIFSYPCTVPETSCISLMEAMAAGCHIVTSDLGALPETAAGFATLVKSSADLHTFAREYGRALLDVLGEGPNEQFLRRQVDFVNANYVWRMRAQQWRRFLTSLR